MGSSGRLITSADIADLSIMNADVNAAAGIALSKLAGGVGLDLDMPVINPEMRWAQRGSSWPACVNGQLIADRWMWVQSGTGVVTGTRAADSDAPLVVGGPVIRNSLQVTVTTADASIGSTDAYFIHHRMEGMHAVAYYERQFTVGFFVMSSVPGIYTLNIVEGAATWSFVAEYTINTANTWEWKTVTVSPSPASAAWVKDHNQGLSLGWTIAVGSSLHATPGSWVSGNKYGTSSHVNGMGTAGNTFRLSGVEMRLGSSIEMYRKPRLDGLELLLCQRYYEEIAAGVVNENFGSGLWITANEAIVNVPYKVRKRATPTVSVSAASDFFLYIVAANTTCTGFTTQSIGVDFVGARPAVASGATGGHATCWAAANTNARIKISAEL